MKNKTKKRVGIVAVVLVLLLAIGAVAGTTLAKYISSATIDSKSATVAKWGYTITADATELFGDKYGSVDADLAVVSDEDAVVVSANSGKNVVAPGTTGTMELTVNGSSEVNAILTFNFDDFTTVLLTDAEEDATVEYYPIKWYIGEQEVEEHNVTMEVLANAIEAVIEEAEIEDCVVASDEENGAIYVFIPANTTIPELDLTISWEWAFDNEVTNEITDANEMDTLLGLISNEVENYKDLPENIKAWLLEKFAEDEGFPDSSEEETYPDGEEDEDYIAAVEEFMQTVFENLCDNSSVEISLKLSVSVEQTQMTADDFSAEYIKED